MTKKTPQQPTLLESKIFTPAEIATMEAESYKAAVSATHQDPDAWQWHRKAVYHEAARNPNRDRAEAEAQRIARVEWKKGPKTIDAMAELVAARLADTGFLKSDGTPRLYKAVRRWAVYRQTVPTSLDASQFPVTPPSVTPTKIARTVPGDRKSG